MKTLIAVFLFATLAFAQHSMHDHAADVKQHGAEAMGFDQDKTTHHFALTKGGGYVQVEANDPKDDSNIKRIRVHLTAQVGRFSTGDFGAPEHTHGQVPPGVPTLQKLKSQIKYVFESLPRGGRLHITSYNPKAIAAIHDFLRFQISDHQTGDPTTVQ